MSNLACKCGDVISDVHYPSDTEAYFQTQRDHEAAEPKIDASIASYLDARLNGTEAEWIRGFFKNSYPVEHSPEEVISDIRLNYETNFVRSACECSSCGRIYVQRTSGENEYVCFRPESGSYEELFKGNREE